MSYITIYMELKSKVGAQKLIGKAVVKDGQSLTVYNDEKVTKTTYEGLKKQNKPVEMINGAILEHYEGMTAHMIKDKIIGDIEQLKTRVNKMMKITYNVEFHK